MTSSFTTSFGKITNKPTVLVRIQSSEGLVGWGESAALPFPFYNPETVDTCMLVLRDYVSPLVLVKPFESVEDLMKRLSAIRGNNMAKTGLETAVWMIFSLQQNISISKMLGGSQTMIAVGESIGIKPSIAETLSEIDERLGQGFQRMKVKIRPGWDFELVKSIRAHFPDISLMVDANSAYTLSDIETLKKLDEFNLTMIEQPLSDTDIIDHAVLQKEIKTSICLDESINSAEDARRAISIGACKIINIKPVRVGGLLESKKIHDICKSHGVGVWCGGAMEFGIGRGFNIAFASLPNCIYPADMSPINFYFTDDVVSNPFKVDEKGYIEVPQTPGLGYNVDEQKINKYTTEKVDCRIK